MLRNIISREFLSFSILCVAVNINNCLANEGPIVNTTLGQVRGVHAADGDYVSFMGIPYARVDPSNPFGRSLPPLQFDGIFDADDDSAICPQEEEFNITVVGTLDCLHLSIFVPSIGSPENPLPVFVWLYGGAFLFGFYGRFLYGPKYLVRHDIILVTLNYRVGPYGFMCTESPLIPGNQGLKDQLDALRWIKENIASFGGDPDNISIGGNSAGSMAVDHHIRRLISNEAPLFHKAIIQSGTALITRAPVRENNSPLLISEQLGYPTTNISDAIAFLATVDPLVMTETTVNMNLPFGICIENVFEGVEAFVTEDWRINTNISGVRNMSILIGYNNDEEAIYFRFGIANPNFIETNLANVFDIEHEEFSGMTNIMRQFYLGDEAMTDEIALDASKFETDYTHIYLTHRTLDLYLNNDAGNIYLYQFSYSGGRNFAKYRNNFTFGGAVHADEIGYLFDISFLDSENQEDQLIMDRMTELWANFVKYGDPTPYTSDLIPYKWEAITRNSLQYYLEINDQLTTGTRMNNDRMTFWELFYETNEHLRVDIPRV